MPDASGLSQFADIARDNTATISVAPSALLAFISHSLGLTAQAIIFSALRASSLLHSETDSKILYALARISVFRFTLTQCVICHLSSGFPGYSVRNTVAAATWPPSAGIT
jgi:hypothetical protein